MVTNEADTDQVLWINHASFQLTSGNVRLVVDPWLNGSAFNEGWSLLAPSVFQPESFDGVTHIWVSHEHPDHFCPRLLKSIPADVRRRITVLFRSSPDGRVASTCRSLGYPVIELDEGQPLRLGPEVEVVSGRANEDSWLFIQTRTRTYLNLNDCVPNDRELKGIAETCPIVDVLFTQFSYANWSGNPGAFDQMKKAADSKLLEMKRYVQALNPRYVVPFASFIWFSQSDNVHLNARANKIGDAHDYLRSIGANPIVMFPGDVWKGSEEHNSNNAISRYSKCYDLVAESCLRAPASVPLVELVDAAREQRASAKRANWLLLFRVMERARRLSPLRIYLSDLDVSLEYSLPGGIRRVSTLRADCDLAMASDSLAFCIRNGYGLDTLLVNGRYEELWPGSTMLLLRHFALPAHNYRGNFFPAMFFRRSYIEQIVRRIFRQARRGSFSRVNEPPKLA